jgi:hypothetical protein
MSENEREQPYAGPGRETTRRDALPDDHGDVKEFVEQVDEEQPEEHLETRIDESFEHRAERPGE